MGDIPSGDTAPTSGSSVRDTNSISGNEVIINGDSGECNSLVQLFWAEALINKGPLWAAVLELKPMKVISIRGTWKIWFRPQLMEHLSRGKSKLHALVSFYLSSLYPWHVIALHVTKLPFAILWFLWFLPCLKFTLFYSAKDIMLIDLTVWFSFPFLDEASEFCTFVCGFSNQSVQKLPTIFFGLFLHLFRQEQYFLPLHSIDP